ncbi:FKBP-type peptidylprolyl isomerase [Haloferax mediterranei ATCC 33500]|uniref:peptidylprolyl isomerase n=2 Tax=Haloferax mediterranei (strain ATCC 33500 / DSM 1411 / JCM 8866 / NBRC 14739 / NCIMB 2177 / R-4) TaxID=523841 RepID=M0J9I1_HALMT|nr:FKBP-type peptidylprolyl isomerase [Haloferax mediterranei ATCC 33500]
MGVRVETSRRRNVILKGRTSHVACMSDEQQAEAEQVDEEVESGIQDGDFVRLAYTVRTVEDGDVVDTTSEEVAEEAEIDVEGYEFEPRVVIVGAGHVFPEVDDALTGAEVGDEGEVDIPAADAFGEYDEDEVRTVSANKIDEDDRYPGAQVTIDGEQGRLETIIGGRARVNFNHPLAGKDLEYEYEVLDLVDDREEQASGLLGMYLQQAPEVWVQTDEVEEEQVVESDDEEDEDAEPETETVTVEKDTLYIEATPQMTMNQQWMFSKQQIAQDIMQRLDIDRVIVQETIEGGMGGMGGLGGMMGGAGGADIEEAIEDVDIDADELAAELDDADEE